MKAICTSFLVGAALLSGCTNNEFPASLDNDPRIRAMEFKYSQMTPYEKAELDRRSSERYMRQMEAEDLVRDMDPRHRLGWFK